MSGCFAGVGNVADDVERFLQSLHLGQQIQSLGQDVVDPSVATEILFRFQFFLAVTHTQQVTFVHVEGHDLLEELIEGHVRVGHDQRPLFGEVVVDVGDDLHGNVRFSRT